MSEVEKLAKLVHQKHYTHLIFDLDETLTQLNLPWHKWVRMISERLSPEAAESFQKALSDPHLAWGTMLNSHIKDYDEFLSVLLIASEEFESTYFAHTPHHELVQYVQELAEQGIHCTLWTSNMRSTAEKALLELGLLDDFDQLITRDDVTFNKPDTEGWQHIRDIVPKDECLFIGDSDNDKLAAKSLGIAYYPITFFKTK